MHEFIHFEFNLEKKSSRNKYSSIMRILWLIITIFAIHKIIHIDDKIQV